MATKNILKSNSVYMLVNRRTGLVLQAPEERGGVTVQQKAAGHKNQLWSASPAQDGAYRFFNANTGLSLDIAYGGTANGTWANGWDEESDSQLWRVEIASRGYRKLTNVKAGKVLDIAFMSMEAGIPAQIWEDVGGETQEWKIVEYPSAEAAALIAGTELKAVAKKAAANSGKLIDSAENVLSDMAGMAAEAANTMKPAVKKARRATKKAVRNAAEKADVAIKKTAKKTKEVAQPVMDNAREKLVEAAEGLIEALKKED